MVQAGDMIGRRFVLSRAEPADLPGVDRYVARDTRLNVDVTVDIVTSLAPSAVIRSAQHARTLRDKRLGRVFAAGLQRHGDDRVSYVVTERPVGVRLDELLGKIAFAPATAAAVVGEAAAALAAVLGSDHHHGMVRAQAITVTEAGRVILSGLGVDGELAAQAGLVKGRTERADAVALANLYLTAVTAKPASEASKADLPDDVPRAAKALCEQVIKGSGPKTLADVVTALGTGDVRVLRTMVAEAPTLWWPRAAGGLLAHGTALEGGLADEIVGPDGATASDDAPGDEPAEAEPEANAEPEPQPASADVAVVPLEDVPVEDVPVEDVPAIPARPRTRFGGAVDDLDEFHDIVAAQNTGTQRSIIEATLEWLHERFPSSAPLAAAAKAARLRAQAPAPLNVGPLLISLLVVAVFVAAIVSASLITKPLDPDIDLHNNPAQTYPEFTIGQTATPTP